MQQFRGRLLRDSRRPLLGVAETAPSAHITPKVAPIAQPAADVAPTVDQPIASVAPQPVEAPQRVPSAQPEGQRAIPRLTGSISLSAPAPAKARPQMAMPAEQPTLTAEVLVKAWQKLLDDVEKRNPDLYNLICDKTVRLEADNKMVIEASNSYFETMMKHHVTPMMEQLRGLCSCRALGIRFEVVHNASEALVYSAKDKYQAMLERNPVMEQLQRIFSEIDL